ncbi:MFS transporter [Thalassobaculum litoreum]|uniref:Predicted arabinose efflux permease, MFS family n=1 Tax=Thalassobaculum litoreum DSM 18839 TaxID=1123362 RepID=A0A8G2BI52_9PROT|nr:MFS transporter [Thalassobaculum litoreum]SDF56664.1 Predicted arabinose efflux permease, MFS family [Thalassobaculum litoreum DSM 18839]
MTDHPILRTLAHREYGLYTLGNGVSLIGMWVQRVALGWLTWELTHSATWLGAVAFADLFPSVLIGLVGGVAADRLDRTLVIFACQSLSMALAVLLGILTLSGNISVEVVVLMTFLNGMVIGFNQPSRLALVPRLVPRERITTAVAINSMVFNTARFIGPAVAGLVIVWADLGWAFIVNALSYLCLLASLVVIRTRNPSIGREGGVPRARRGLIGDIAEGMRYGASDPGLGPILLLHLVTAISVRAVTELLPGFADHVFGGGADTLAMMTSVTGVGAIIGGWMLAGRRQEGGLVPIVLVASIVVALSVLAVALSGSLWIALPALAVYGASMVAAGVGTQTIVQLAVPSDKVGRVLSLHGIIFRGGPAIGALAMGAAGDVVGLEPPVIFGCVAALAVIAVIWMRRRAISSAVDRAE